MNGMMHNDLHELYSLKALYVQVSCDLCTKAVNAAVSKWL